MTKPVPPVVHGFIDDLGSSLVEEILEVSKRLWETDVKHHRQTNDQVASLGVAEGDS